METSGIGTAVERTCNFVWLADWKADLGVLGMMTYRAFVAVLCTAISNFALAVGVTTYHNDANRSGANLSETLLTVANVNQDHFGKLFELAVDDDIYAQILYVPKVEIPHQGQHNVVYAVTQNDSIYAFDADDTTGSNAAPLWRVSLVHPPSTIPVPSDDVGNPALGNLRSPGQIGIMGTPVIDTASKTMYFVARTKEGSVYVQRLHALDITDGSEKFGAPVVIEARSTGKGAGSYRGTVSFLPREQNQRPGLALGNDAVYLSWASHNDLGNYHGWLLAYDAHSLTQIGVFNVTPDGYAGGIWQSGQPPAMDAAGNLYVATGNGSFSAATAGRDYGQSVVKLAPRNLRILDWFTPYNWQTLNEADLDLNSAGPVLLPNDRLVTGGKDGKLYLLNTNSLGHLAADNKQVVGNFQVTGGGHIHGSAVYYDSPVWGALIYVWGEVDYLKAFRFNGNALERYPLMQSATVAPDGMPGASLSLSADGNNVNTGILWAAMPKTGDANAGIVPGILRAYDAVDLRRELWNSTQVAERDRAGDLAKFVPPTIANGRVYLPTLSQKIVVYGLLDRAAYGTKRARPLLQVAKSGAGWGNVRSDPPGINCGSKCRAHFARGRLISLIAKPRAPFHFRGWQGACPNRGRVCRFRLRSDRQITARFE